MKRWVVDLTEGKVFLSSSQHEPHHEYVAEYNVVFASAQDELGAWARAKQLMEQTDEVLASTHPRP